MYSNNDGNKSIPFYSKVWVEKESGLTEKQRDDFQKFYDMYVIGNVDTLYDAPDVTLVNTDDFAIVNKPAHWHLSNQSVDDVLRGLVQFNKAHHRGPRKSETER